MGEGVSLEIRYALTFVFVFLLSLGVFLELVVGERLLGNLSHLVFVLVFHPTVGRGWV
jgi:hypothetical protein